MRFLGAAKSDWGAAALLGLLTSSFSTLAAQLFATRIGRDAVIDWMVVAAIPLRDGVLQPEPGWGTILGGILFHQWADFSWALVFFGLFGRWTARLGPGAILLLCLPWAVFTSALEWLVLVPLFPFWQPVFPLNQAWWIGLLVHLSSASLYPLFPWLRDRVAGRRSSPGRRRFARLWGGAAVVGLAGLGLLAFLGSQGRELPHWGGAEFDAPYMRRMAAHHAQGVELALLGAERAQDRRLRALAGLMAAEQRGEIAIFAQWWRSWFPGELPPASAEDHAMMPGMLPPATMAAVRATPVEGFDAAFMAAMSHHHQGAVAMADEALLRAADPRLRLMAHAIRHGQRGEIALMRNTQGLDAVRTAIADLLLPAGEAPPDQPGPPPPGF
ncbi:DUF305 domain-containing protein [Belnapia sp. T6]|uniref:DUF305 domain-containing protein n=1 Tax=Belnapia mucosa TaxID=2804532 RepID=A0ABS1V4I5_9PROT|nr:DUF305 domain-containing protein [Belnapia mucosa]MBL6456157.1 DUF305 domain-containing protein [Belnapia mucosa]